MAIAGWALAILLILRDEPTPVGIVSAAINVGAIGTILLGAMLLNNHGVDAAYRLGVEVGKRTMLEQMNRAAQVTPIRRTPDGLNDFNRRAVTRSRAARPGGPSRRVTARD